MAPEDRKQLDPSENSADGHASTLPEQTKSTDPRSMDHLESSPGKSAAEPKDRWDESEIDAAVGVLERPSQIPVPSTRPTAASDDPLEDVANSRELRVSAPSASSVEKSRRSGAPPPGEAAHAFPGRVGPEACVAKSGVDESEEETHYYERSQLAPAPTASKAKDSGAGSGSEIEEDTRYYERRTVKSQGAADAEADRDCNSVKTPGTDAEAHAPRSAGAAATIVRPMAKGTSAPIGVRVTADPRVADNSANSGPASTLRKSETREGGTDAIRSIATKPEARSTARSEAESEEPTTFYERPSLVVPSPNSSSQAQSKATGASVNAGGPALSWSMERQSSVSLGVGIGLLSTDPEKALGQGRAFPDSARASAPAGGALPTAKPPFGKHPPDSALKSEQGLTSSSTGIGNAVTYNRLASPLASAAKGALAGPVASGSPSLPVAPMPLSTAVVSDADHSRVPEDVSVSPLGTAADVGRSVGNAELDPLSERLAEPSGSFDFVGSGALTGVTAFTLAPRSTAVDDAELGSVVPRALRRLLSVTASCVVAALALAPLEAWFAQRASAEQVSFITLTAACAGLMIPVALAMAIAAMGLSVMLHPESSPSLTALPKTLRPNDVRRRARLAVILGLSPLGISAWMILSARAALPLLAANAPSEVAGTLLAVSGVGLALVIAAPILAAARYVGVRLRRRPPDPVRWAVAGLLLGILPLVYAIASGPTSGAGSAFAIFGVFKRPELDLRAPVMLLTLLLAGYLLPSRLNRWPWLARLALSLIPLGLTYAAGVGLLEKRAVSLAIERGAPVSRAVLPIARRLTDRDRDGFGRGFGGGDCDDRNPARNPAADDTPGNGLDEDCSGADSVGATTRSLAVTPAELLQERRAAIPEQLNLILLIVDTMRADVLRHPKRITPRIDQLCEESVVVNNAYAPASYTGKSVGPLLIGKHSSETNRDFGHFSAFSKKDTFVQQRLQAAGVRTLSAQSYWYFHQPQYGFDRGFDVVDAEASTSAGYVEGDRSSTAEKLTDRILAQLDLAANTSGRFFLWSQYMDPHAEYVWHKGFEFGPLSIDKYRGEVAFVDYQIGRVLDFVRSKPWGARTAIVITSDHGEAFGEHAMIRHGFELWEPLVRVPLVIYVPGVGARQIQSRRSLIDLAPTILDLLQVQAPEGSGSDFMSGRSLLPEILGIEGADQSRPVLVDMAQGPYTNERQAYIDGSFKLITAQGRPIGLFDLSTDPEEKKDLLDNAQLRERIMSEYRAYKKAMRVVEVKSKP